MEKNNRKVASAARRAALTALGERLRAARTNAGLTQQRVAQHLKITAQTVRNWEGGRSEPTEHSMETLAALYNVPWERLEGQTWESSSEVHDNRPDQRVRVEPNLLQDARKASGLAQTQAAELAGVSTVSLRRYEQGTVQPTRTMLRRMALIYEKPTYWFDPADTGNRPEMEAPHMDRAMRTYLNAQPDLNLNSVETIADFILFTHKQQMKRDREQNSCASVE